ncbi:hypothetical protein FRB95_009686 [Tulasnella sp. JGI-2019a]|nr:hypothetical protein FRB95_009686 [Tulasnella sp. JGI-2019a]
MHLDDSQSQLLTGFSPLDYTHVLYNPDSTTSQLLAFVTLSPILLFASYAALVVWTRELTIILCLIGQLLNEALNNPIKRYFQAERPLSSHGSGFAFPSSHSQYMAFFVTFLLLHFSRRHSFLSHGYRILDSLQWVVFVGVLILWAGAVAYSRIFLHYHTPIQVVGGLAVGSLFGALWYLLVEFIPLQRPQSLLGQLRRTILDSSVAQWIRLRDGWAVYTDGGHEAEWVRWREEWNRRKNVGLKVKRI